MLFFRIHTFVPAFFPCAVFLKFVVEQLFSAAAATHSTHTAHSDVLKVYQTDFMAKMFHARFYHYYYYNHFELQENTFILHTVGIYE